MKPSRKNHAPQRIKSWTREELEDCNNWSFGSLNGHSREQLREMWNYEIQREFGSRRPPFISIRGKNWKAVKPLKAWLRWKPLRIRGGRFVGNMKEIPESEKFLKTFYCGPAFPSNFEVLFRFDLGASKDALKDAFVAWLERPEVKELRAQVSSKHKRGRGEAYIEWLRDLAIYRFASGGLDVQKIREHIESEFKQTNLVGKQFDWSRAVRLTKSRINKYWTKWLSFCEKDSSFAYIFAEATQMPFPASVARENFPEFAGLPVKIKWIRPVLPPDEDA